MLKNNEYFDGKVKSIGFDSESTGAAALRDGRRRIHIWHGKTGRNDGHQWSLKV